MQGDEEKGSGNRGRDDGGSGDGWVGGWLGVGMTKWQKVQELAQTVWSVSQLSPSLSNFGEISQPHVFSTSENGDPSRGFFTGWLWKEMSFYVRNAERRLNPASLWWGPLRKPPQSVWERPCDGILILSFTQVGLSPRSPAQRHCVFSSRPSSSL